MDKAREIARAYWSHDLGIALSRKDIYFIGGPYSFAEDREYH